MPSIPFALQCSIDENELMALKDTGGGRILSASITNIPEFEYYLKIYPNGYKEKRQGQMCIAIYLELKNVKKVNADLTFAIESANYSKKGYYSYEKSTSCCIGICTTEELFNPTKKYIVNGKFTFKINGIFKYENDNDASLDVEEQIWEGGQLGDELWDKNETKDFTIVVDGEEIEVHKFILSNRSEVFTAMLNSNMQESIENKVEITDFTFAVVETALGIIYNCNFTTSLSLDELISLLQFFDKYQLPALKEQAEPYLIQRFAA